MAATRLDSVLHYVRKVVGTQAEHGSDADLLQRFVRHHDETAFELLLWRHAAMVLRVCQGVLRDSHAAEDAFQATFLLLARKAATISRSDALAGWLYQVAYRVAVRARLSAVERRAHEARRQERSPVAAPRDEAAERDLVPLVHEEVNRLAAKYRTPLILCYLEGKTHAEAARQLGWAKGTVSGRLARAREMLKKRLERRGVLLPASVLAVALTTSKSSAVPPALMAVTIHAAVAFAAGNVVGAGVSNGVLHLTHGVLNAMCLSKIKATSAAVVAFLLIFAGTGALIRVGLLEVSAQGASDPRHVPQYAYHQPPTAVVTELAGAEESPEGSGGPGEAGVQVGGSYPGQPGLPGGSGVGGPGAGGPGVGGASGPGGIPGGPGGVPGGSGGLPGGFGGSAPPTAQDNVPDRKRRIESINNLKQIGLAVHNYHDTHGCLPSDILDEDGQPLLSWRVAILPFIEQDALYREFKLNEPWDSEHNSKLVAKMPAIYLAKGDADANPGPGGMPGGRRPGGQGPGAGWTADKKTYYQGFCGWGTAFERPGKLRLTDFTDGTSNTILVVEAGTAVEWSKPYEIFYSAKKPIPPLGGPFPDCIHALFADGAVHTLTKKFDEQNMRRAIVRNDGEVVDFGKLGAAAQQLPLRMPPPGAGGAPGLPGVGGSGGPGGPGVPPSNTDLKRLYDENAKLEQLLQRTAQEMEALRQEVNQVKEQYAQRREQVEAKKLLAEREKLRQQLEAANAEVKAMRDELQQLKRGLGKP